MKDPLLRKSRESKNGKSLLPFVLMKQGIGNFINYALCLKIVYDKIGTINIWRIYYMKKKLRMTSLVMLVIAVIFVIIAFLSMDSTLTLPFTVEQLHAFYKTYLIVMILLFVASFFVKGKKD